MNVEKILERQKQKREASKKYRQTTKYKETRRKRESTPEFKAKQKEYNKRAVAKFKEKHPEKYRKQIAQGALNYYHRTKNKVYDLLGNNCEECGCNIVEALELNHVNGGGYSEENQDRSARYRKILKDPEERKRFNILCRVCNAHHYLRDLKNIKGGIWNVTFIKDKELTN